MIKLVLNAPLIIYQEMFIKTDHQLFIGNKEYLSTSGSFLIHRRDERGFPIFGPE